jgi:hypothetical protein
MSTLRVNKIVNYNDDGPVEFSSGASFSSTESINGDFSINSVGIITSTSLTVNNGMNLSGVVTSASFSGKGINLTNVPGTPNGKGIAFVLIS